MLPDKFVIPKGTLKIAVTRCDKTILGKILSQNVEEEEVESLVYQALTDEKRNIDFVQTCLSSGFDPNHLFERDNNVESFLNLCILADKNFFDLIMEYNPITTRVTQKSPLEVAFENNVSFIDDVLPLADKEYSKDMDIIKRIKYINNNPIPVPIEASQKEYIETVLLMDKAFSLVDHKVLVFVPNYVCDTLVCSDPDEFEARETGFFNVFDQKKLYRFSNVDTITVGENNRNIECLTSCLTAIPSKCRVLIARVNPGRHEEMIKSFTGIVNGETETGTFSILTIEYFRKILSPPRS